MKVLLLAGVGYASGYTRTGGWADGLGCVGDVAILDFIPDFSIYAGRGRAREIAFALLRCDL